MCYLMWNKTWIKKENASEDLHMLLQGHLAFKKKSLARDVLF